MTKYNRTDLSSAFEALLKVVDTELESAHKAVDEAFEASEYVKAKEFWKRAAFLSDFRDRLVCMLKEWESLTVVKPPEKKAEVKREALPKVQPAPKVKVATPKAQRRRGRARTTLRTPDKAYFIPILKVLDEMGGSATTKELRPRLEKMMKPILNEADYAPSSSNPQHPIWWDRARWARLELVRSGLVKKDSPQGVWEISRKGRTYLKEHSKKSR